MFKDSLSYRVKTLPQKQIKQTNKKAKENKTKKGSLEGRSLELPGTLRMNTPHLTAFQPHLHSFARMCSFHHPNHLLTFCSAHSLLVFILGYHRLNLILIKCSMHYKLFPYRPFTVYNYAVICVILRGPGMQLSLTVYCILKCV